jgi:squalene synthase HpnC
MAGAMAGSGRRAQVRRFPGALPRLWTPAMQVFADSDIEANSGKGAGDENFPVGSRLVAPQLRPHFLAYYGFARATDDIADCPHLSPDEKIRRLDAFEAVLEGRASGLARAEALRRSLAATGIATARATDLLVAFRDDATKTSYATIAELRDYCRHSADPVGRFLLDLHRESPALYPASDALCTALQILNHLQDMGEDLDRLDRAYVPLDWLEAEGETVEALGRDRVSPGLRRVMDRLLDEVDRLLGVADGLARLRTRSLAGEAAAIRALARRLVARLRRDDPLATRVALSKADFAAALGKGLVAGLLGRAA